MKSRAILPFVALVAYLGAQSENSAKTIGNLFPSLTVPPATGSIQLIACDSSGTCSANAGAEGGGEFQFPQRRPTQTITRGSNSATATINYKPSLFSSSISARLYGYPGSEDYVTFTYFFGFGYPPGVTGEIGAAVTANIQTSGNVSGGPSSLAQVRIFPQFQFNNTVFSDYACTATCPDGASLKGSFSDAKNLHFYENTIYVIQMTIGLSFTNSTAGRTLATASIDPIVTMDPQSASHFQLVLSPNLTPRRQQ
jgi:hypothetical protein